MRFVTAKELAERLARLIDPGCVRLEIVGSVKRADKNEVHDIEFLVIANEKTPRPEFGQKVLHKTMLDKLLYELCLNGVLKFIKGGDKYKQYAIVEAQTINPFCLELWIVNPSTWGIQNVIRTGPKEFSHRFVTPKSIGGLLPDDCQYIRGETRIERNGQSLSLPEEKDAIELIGRGWIAPKDRWKLARKGS
jgi:DNA polymerase/3'-5' exonuclease PolX